MAEWQPGLLLSILERRRGATSVLILLTLWLLVPPRSVQCRAQDAVPNTQPGGVSRDAQREIAERFMQVLLRRPRAGTALDRVFSYHTENESLDTLIASLDVDQQAPQAGAKQMVLGLIQSQRGDTEASITALKKAEGWLPQDPMASFALANAYLAEGDSDLALEALERSIGRGPDRRDAATIYLELGRLYLNDGRDNEAITTWNELIDRYPDDLSIAEKVASWLARQQRFEEALGQYVKLSKKAKTDDARIGYRVAAAEVRLQLGQVDPARDELQQILARLRPGSWLHTDVRSRIERSFLSAGDVEALIGYYNDLADTSPDDTSPLVRLGEILAGSGRDEEAESAFRRVLEVAPGNVSARTALVEILVARGKSDEAADQLEILLKSDPGNPDYLLRLGEVHLDNTKESIADCRKAAANAWNRLIETRPNDAVLLSTIAKKMHSIEATDRAVELYRKAIDADPDSPQYREYLGNYFYRLGRKDEAIEAWKTIASGPRRNRSALVRLAEVFQASDFPELALETWREAAELDLSFEERLRFANVLEKSENFDEAFEQIDQATDLAQDDEQTERLMRQQIELLAASGRIGQSIAELSIAEPNAENQRRLALMFLANRQLASALIAIEKSLESSPDDIAILSDAVNIAEEMRRLSQASAWLSRLAKLDVRFRVNHLRRLIQIHGQLGQIDEAMTAAQKMIDLNPAAPEAYRLYADLAFSAGRNEEGERSLRRAIFVAPRDASARLILAKRLAERFETEKAVDLYWEAIQYENNLRARTDLIRELVPLYARRGEVDVLVGRIDRFDVNLLGPRDKQILVASVWSSVQDFDQAQIALQGALNKQPRDTELLTAMVDNLVQSGKSKEAVSFQRRLLNVNDTPSNAARLASLELAAGLITPLEAKTREIKASDDPKRVARIAIRDATQNPEQAAELCAVALERFPDLWDLKIVRAQLLLLSDKSTRGEDLAEADRIAREIEQLTIDMDVKVPTGESLRPSQTARVMRSSSGRAITLPILRTPSRSAAPSQFTFSGRVRTRNNPFGAASVTTREKFPETSAFTLHTIQRLNERRISSRANSGSRSYSFAFGSNYISPRDFFDSKWLAINTRIVAAYELAKLDEKKVTYGEIIERLYPKQDLQAADLETIRKAVALHKVESTVNGSAALPPEELVWRHAQLDPDSNHPDLLLLLTGRSKLRESGVSLKSPVPAEERGHAALPLDDAKLAILKKVVETHHQLAYTESRDISRILDDLRFRQYMNGEFRLAGHTHPLAENEVNSQAKSSFRETLLKIQVAIWEKNSAGMEELVGQLVQAARRDQGTNSASKLELNWMLSPSNDDEKAFVVQNHEQLIDAWLAHCSRMMISARGNLQPSEMFGGETIQIVVPQLATGKQRQQFEIFRLTPPLSEHVFDEQLLRGFVALLPARRGDGASRMSLTVPDKLIERLRSPLDGATPHEQRLRKIVAAFAAWWDNRPYECFVQLEAIADESPSDVDLQIETARLAVVVDRTPQAFARLNKIPTEDDATREQVTLARILLAARAGDDERVRSSANQLLARPLDPATKSFLSAKLKQHATRNQAVATVGQAISQAAPIRVSRPNVTRQNDMRLELAEKMLKSGDAVTAAEVAFSIVNSGQGAPKRGRSRASARAIEILAETGRLQPLITMTERKFRANPESDAYRQELADLYVAAGQPEKAGELWKQVINALKLSPRQIVMRASAYRGRRDFHHAAMLYLFAFERDPDLWQSHWNVFTESAAQSPAIDIIYEQLCRIDIQAAKPYALCGLIKMRGSGVFTDAQRRFVKHVISNHPGMASHLDLLIRAIPASEKAALPEFRELMIDAITDANAYADNSPMWALRGWSSDGAVLGILSAEMAMLWNDQQAAEQFLAAVDATGNQNRPVARMLKAVYQLGSDSTRDAAVKTIRELVAAEQADLGDGAKKKRGKPPRLPAGLLWQVGQLLEAVEPIEDKPLLRISVFETALRYSGNLNATSSNVGTPRDQLLHEYAKAGRGEDARAGWLQRLQSEELPRTTGVREDRQLLLASHVSENLLKTGFPVDAAGVCRSCLDKPVLFQLARRSGKGRFHRRILETTFQSAMDAINPQASHQYLDALTNQIDRDQTKVEIDLHSTTLTAAKETAQDSLFELAVRAACETEAGQKAARRLLEKLAPISKSEKASPSLVTAQLILTMSVDPDRIGSVVQDLARCLPSPSDVSGKKGMDREHVVDQLAELAIVLAALRRSGFDDRDDGLEPLLDRLGELAAAISEEPLVIEFSRLSRRPDAMNAFLDSIEQASKGRPPTSDVCEQCLRLAKAASKKREWEIVARALEVGIGKGPPTQDKLVTKNVSDVYGGAVPARDVVGIDDPLRKIRALVLDVLNDCRDQSGQPISSSRFDSATCPLDSKQVAALEESLRKVIFPSDLFVNVYAFHQPVVTEETSTEILALSYAAGNLAQIRKTSHSLIQRVRDRINSVLAPETVALFVDLALSSGDRKSLSEAIAIFHEVYHDRLPLGQSPGVDEANADGNVFKPTPPRGASQILTLADEVIRTLLPVAEVEDLGTEDRSKVNELLLRTSKLMKGDERVRKSHLDLIDRIEVSAVVRQSER